MPSELQYGGSLVSRASSSTTVASLFFAPAKTHPDRIALEDSSRRFTYGELATRTRRLAGAMAARGVGRGTRIAVLSENRSEWLELFLAAARLGAIATCPSWRLDLIGKLTFTEMTFFQITGRMPNEGQTRVLDACLVTLMEHGLTPSAIAARLVYGSSPEALQGAVAAGLLGVGSVFVGTVEGCAAVLDRLVAASDLGAEARAIAEEHRAAKRSIPGFGHPQHKPDDPRTPRILAVAEENRLAGSHVKALRALGEAIDAVYGKHITINATGAIAAVLSDCDIHPEIMRGFSIIARCAGLVGHIHEEQRTPAMRALWAAADGAVPYEEP
jgi:citrate synthase